MWDRSQPPLFSCGQTTAALSTGHREGISVLLSLDVEACDQAELDIDLGLLSLDCGCSDSSPLSVGAAKTTIVGGNGTLIDNGIGTVVRGNFHPPA
jgi:hypothetical protein